MPPVAGNEFQRPPPKTICAPNLAIRSAAVLDASLLSQRREAWIVGWFACNCASFVTRLFMLSRYQMLRGRPVIELPREVRAGIRKDTRKHTRHVLRPDAEQVARYLASSHPGAFEEFKRQYLQLLERRFAADRSAFDELALQAQEHDVFLGCSCPTAKNPSVRHCHTWLALQFMKQMYPGLAVKFGDDSAPISSASSRGTSQ